MVTNSSFIWNYNLVRFPNKRMELPRIPQVFTIGELFNDYSSSPNGLSHEAEGRMGYWLRGYEGERNNCLSKIQLVGQKKYRD